MKNEIQNILHRQTLKHTNLIRIHRRTFQTEQNYLKTH